MKSAALLALLLAAPTNELQKNGQKMEAEAKKGVTQVGQATQRLGKKFDKGVNDAVKSLKESLKKK